MMKNTLLFAAFLLCISCNNTTNTEKSNTSATDAGVVDNMGWLLGSWERIGGEEGKVTHEYWNKTNDREYKGLGCTLVGKDTVWQEDMLLINRNGDWTFEVKVTDDEQATVFGLTDLTENSFVCENDKNEFPKKIEYYRDKHQLKARISGGGPEVPYEFKKMQ